VDVPDLNKVVDELDRAAERAGTVPDQLSRWLDAMLAQNGSDLFLVSRAPPNIRVHGNVVPLDTGARGRRR